MASRSDRNRAERPLGLAAAVAEPAPLPAGSVAAARPRRESEEPGRAPPAQRRAKTSISARDRDLGPDLPETAPDPPGEGDLASRLGFLCLETPRPAKPCEGDTVLIVYDTETTGLGATDKVRIVELGESERKGRARAFSLTMLMRRVYLLYAGAVAAIYKEDEGWVPIEEFQRYVALPGNGAAAINASVPHDISVETLRDAKPFHEDCGPAFAKFVARHAGTRATVVVGHNAKRYDHRLLVFHGWLPPAVPSAAGLRFADSLDWLRSAHPKLASYSIKVRCLAPAACFALRLNKYLFARRISSSHFSKNRCPPRTAPFPTATP